MIMRYLRTVLVALGVAGIIAYLLFPSEKTYECLKKDLDFSSYGDSANGVAFVEAEAFAFRCSLFRENGNCGISLIFSQLENWNLVDSLDIELEYANFEELIVQVLTYDRDHSDMDKPSTMKPALKEVKIKPGQTRYSIYMEHFYTPDYWYEQQGAENSGNMKRFSAIAGLQIFSGWKNKTDTPLELKIKNICTESHSNTPFVALILYLGTLIAIAISVRVKDNANG